MQASAEGKHGGALCLPSIRELGLRLRTRDGVDQIDGDIINEICFSQRLRGSICWLVMSTCMAEKSFS
jgi:hypothetical protein